MLDPADKLSGATPKASDAGNSEVPNVEDSGTPGNQSLAASQMDEVTSDIDLQGAKILPTILALCSMLLATKLCWHNQRRPTIYPLFKVYISGSSNKARA